MRFEFAIAIRDVTPPPGLPMGGYAARAGVSEGVLDPLRCRVALLSDGDAAVVVVLLDLVYVSQEWVKPVREQIARSLGCAPANVLIAATHTHAGPAVFRSGMVDCDALRLYERQTAAAALRAVDEARQRLQPATLALGRATVTGVGAGRRETPGGTEAPVDVLLATTPSGTRIGAIAVFGCHPTVLPAANLLYSADLFGAAERAAEERIEAPVLLCNGAAADVSTRFTRREQTAGEVKRLGEMLGGGISRASSLAVPVRSTPLRGKLESIGVRAVRIPPREEAEEKVASAARRLQEVRSSGAPGGQERVAASHLEGALAQLLLCTAGGPEALLGRTPDRAVLQLIQIGDCDILGVPGELFSATARQICASRRREALLVGYANDYLGYIVPLSICEEGGYESLMAMIEPSSAEALAGQLAQMRFD